MRFVCVFLFAVTLTLSAKSFADETRVKIAVIDTGIRQSKEIAPFLCSADLHRDFSGQGLDDPHGHGTNVAALIARSLDPKKECLVIIRYWMPVNSELITEQGQVNRTVQAFQYATSILASYINYSSGGESSSAGERSAIAQALEMGARVSVAAGNEAQNLGDSCNYFPACYPFKNANFYAVASYSPEGKRHSFSNYGGPVNAKEDGLRQEGGGITMSGASMATAIWTGKLVAKERSTR